MAGAKQTAPRRPTSARKIMCRRRSGGRSVGVAATAMLVLGLVSFPRHVDSFLARPTCLAKGRGKGMEVWTCRQKPRAAPSVVRRGPRVAMNTEKAAIEEETPAVVEQRDRDTDLARANERYNEDDDGYQYEGVEAYASTIMNPLPSGPYHFKVPGEFGNDTLCTDPDWHTTLNALAWLGCPYEVEHDSEEDEPNLLMADEVYDNAKDLLGFLPERCMLADFVETLPKIGNVVHKLQPAWVKVYLNTDKSQGAELSAACDDTLEKLEKALKFSKGDFLEGEELTIGDLELAVVIYHMMAAFGIEKKNWDIPRKEFPRLHNFAAMMHDMSCFKGVMPSKENIALRYKAMEQD